MEIKFFTSESVTEGHPDKICDQIADAVLDDLLGQDKNSRVACEVVACTGMVMVMGEISTLGYADIPAIARRKIAEIGYKGLTMGFDAETCAVLTTITEQSPDIAQGVDKSAEFKSGGGNDDLIGAGDQGYVFGYACDETPELMPLSISLAHSLTQRLAAVRKNGEITYLRPDGKSQVTIEYHDGLPVRVDTVVVSCQHDDNVSIETIKKDVIKKVIQHCIPAKYLDENTKIYINPTGKFVIGGPQGDSGLTGRKIIADSYGGHCPHGGGAFSGKDPTKMDRSAAYMARYICKNVVAAGLAKRCELQISYCIGHARPVSIAVNTYNTSKLTDSQLTEIINQSFDMRPSVIIKNLKLDTPIYSKTSVYGHFGRDEFSWEQTDKTQLLKEAAKRYIKE